MATLVMLSVYQNTSSTLFSKRIVNKMTNQKLDHKFRRNLHLNNTKISRLSFKDKLSGSLFILKPSHNRGHLIEYMS